MHLVKNEGWIGLALLGGALSLTACSRPGLSTPGARVAAAATSIEDNGLDPKSCKNLGPVIGKSGGALGGFVPNDRLLEYALNDLRNKSADRGANFVHYTAPQFGKNQDSDTGVTIAGTAYRCERRAR